MSEAKTRPTEQSVDGFLAQIADERQREDSRAMVTLMGEITGAEPRMWGESIVGFGSYRYRYASGREGDWMLSGFAPRKQNLTLYFSNNLEQQVDLLDRLGKHKLGKGCLYIKRLSDVDQGVLRELIERSIDQVRQTHTTGAAAE